MKYQTVNGLLLKSKQIIGEKDNEKMDIGFIIIDYS